jgi:tetratricopeptide (TPR) repeat protein
MFLALPLPSARAQYSNRGFAYMAKGQPDRAIQDFNEAIRLNPNSALAFFNRGLAKRAKGDFTGGDADIAEVHRLNPSVRIQTQ